MPISQRARGQQGEIHSKDAERPRKALKWRATPSSVIQGGEQGAPGLGQNKIHQLSRDSLSPSVWRFVQQTQGVGSAVPGFREGGEKHSLRTNNVFYLANRVWNWRGKL